MYILSPSSKKHAHEKAVAAKAPVEKALPPPEKKEEQQPSHIMKDDEGTEADVSQSEKAGFVCPFYPVIHVSFSPVSLDGRLAKRHENC